MLCNSQCKVLGLKQIEIRLEFCYSWGPFGTACFSIVVFLVTSYECYKASNACHNMCEIYIH